MISFLKRIIAGDCDRREAVRLDFIASCRYLEKLELLSAAVAVKLPERLPQYNDIYGDGVRFFRARMADLVLDNLTLPRLFVSHSEVEEVTFVNSELRESNWCWNALVNVDFTGADLSGSDLRSTYFTNTNFTRTDLRGVDFRHAVFENCCFDNADLSQAKMTGATTDCLDLDVEQVQSIDLCRNDGPEPPGA